MAPACGFKTLDALIDATILAAIRTSLLHFSGKFEASFTESQMLNHEQGTYKSFIGMGVLQICNTHVPAVNTMQPHGELHITR